MLLFYLLGFINYYMIIMIHQWPKDPESHDLNDLNASITSCFHLSHHCGSQNDPQWESPMIRWLIHWSWCVGVYRFHFKTAGWLLVATPLKNISQMGLLFKIYYIYIWEKMFQTTNQLVDHWLISSQTAWWIIPSKWYHPRDVEPMIHDHKGLTVWEEPPMIGESATKIYPAW